MQRRHARPRKADKGSRLWVDLDQPTDDELKLLTDVFHFHPLAVEDAAGLHAQRSKIEPYFAENGDADRPDDEAPAYYFMVFHGPDLETNDRLATKELDVFMSEQYLVTIHRRRMFAVENTIKRIKPNPKASLNDEGLDLLLHSILDQIVDAYFPILDALQEKIDKLEDLATDSPKRIVLRRINRMKRELLGFRRTIAPQRDVLNSLTRGEVPFIDEKARIYLRRRLRPPEPRRGNGRTLSRPRQRRSRRLPVFAEQQPEPGDEDADDHHGDRAAVDGDHRLLRHELRRHPRPALGEGVLDHRHRHAGRRRRVVDAVL
ncbi:MAG: magnesium transporter CorA family protein [Tepidisphaeraceae bacterium]